MAAQGFLSRPIFSLFRLLPRQTLSFQPQCGLNDKYTQQLTDLNVPEKPKRPLSAYFRYLNHRRGQLADHSPQLKATEVTKLVAQDWRALDEHTKKAFEADYQHEAAAYKQRYSEYKAKLTPEQSIALREYGEAVRAGKERRATRRQNREHDKPKRSLNSYMLYVNDEMRKAPGKKMSELLVELKDKWAGLEQVEKVRYQERAQRAKAEYEAALGEWEEEMLRTGNEQLVRKKVLEERRPATARKLKRGE